MKSQPNDLGGTRFSHDTAHHYVSLPSLLLLSTLAHTLLQSLITIIFTTILAFTTFPLSQWVQGGLGSFLFPIVPSCSEDASRGSSSGWSAGEPDHRCLVPPPNCYRLLSVAGWGTIFHLQLYPQQQGCFAGALLY